MNLSAVPFALRSMSYLFTYCAGDAATSRTTWVPPLNFTSPLAPTNTPDSFDAPVGVLLARRTPGIPVVRIGWLPILPTTAPVALLVPVADPWPGPMPLIDWSAAPLPAGPLGREDDMLAPVDAPPPIGVSLTTGALSEGLSAASVDEGVTDWMMDWIGTF